MVQVIILIGIDCFNTRITSVGYLALTKFKSLDDGLYCGKSDIVCVLDSPRSNRLTCKEPISSVLSISKT
jgi:hypothetical protein